MDLDELHRRQEEQASHGGGKLGLSNINEHDYETLRMVNGYTFDVAPVSRFSVREAQTRFVALTGSLNPVFKRESFDSIRERMQVGEKKEKNTNMEAMAVLAMKKMTENFQKETGGDLPELERMFYPRYFPSYAAAIRALSLPRRWWYTHQPFQTLENLSRLPLDRFNFQKECAMSFEEWYNLFWGFHMPFNTCHLYCNLVAQSSVYTQEFVDSLSGYLADRLDSFDRGGDVGDAPVLHVGSQLGKLAFGLNQSKRLRVPVIATHERPRPNPYLLVIPNNRQTEFKINPIEKSSLQQALDKHRPRIVIVSDLQANKDVTQVIRGCGSVKEYLYLGMPDSHIEGHGWDTWGIPHYRPKDDKELVPAHLADHYHKLPLPHLGRYLIHKYDNTFVMGLGNVTSFHKDAVRITKAQQRSFFRTRLLTRF